MLRNKHVIALWAFLIAVGLMLPAVADHEPVTDGADDHSLDSLAPMGDPSDPLERRDALAAEVISSGPTGKQVKNLALVGRGERLVAGATTDVWAHAGYAYIGTFNSPCGTGEGYESGFGEVELQEGPDTPGIPVFDVSNRNRPSYVGNLPSVEGSRINDVKVAAMNGGDILVHSNEPCDGGPGGFEIYSVDDPTRPVHLAHVQTDDINSFLRTAFGFTDFGVHNLYLFTRDGRDYVAAQVEGELGNFQVFDITDPAAAEIVTWFGAEYVLDPSVDWANTTDFGQILAADAYLFSGYGASANRFLHDFYVTPDGTQAYLANWDAGLLLVDLGDLDGSAATLISQALDPTSEDGEVNSHSVWPSGDGSVVIEGEEDFNPFATTFSITSGSAAGDYPAVEGAITAPIAGLPGATMAGPTTYVGLACDGDPLPAATSSDAIALIQRGVCAFTEKIDNADAAGYAGVVVFNDAARGDGLVVMGGDPVDLPGVFVGHSTGLLIAGVASADDLVVGDAGESVAASVVPNGWSGFRVWDYSDPANPVLASTFNTVCSENPVHASCNPAGTYSSHNVIVEDTDDGRVKAYISWYSDGMVILDITDPYAPRETARYFDNSAEFLASNGGQPHDFWGVYKVPGEPWIYGSDRNGGLYIFKETGPGSGKR